MFFYFSLNKTSPYFSIYTINKTFPKWGKPKMEGKTWVRNWSPELGEGCARFRFQIWGDRSHCLYV